MFKLILFALAFTFALSKFGVNFTSPALSRTIVDCYVKANVTRILSHFMNDLGSVNRDFYTSHIYGLDAGIQIDAAIRFNDSWIPETMCSLINS